tara:strand:- start:1045 stop:1164 length:120 start_codon:yes stop_codon:yes gene_type:complete
MVKEESNEVVLKKVFLITMVCATLFIGTILIFIAPYPNP